MAKGDYISVRSSIPVGKIVSHVFEFENCIEAIDYSLNNKNEVVKGVIKM